LRFEDVPPLLSLLTRSATGQAITTYFNMISGIRQAEEKDGPHEVHLILLDNGRSQMHADDLLQETLLCIRCGACMNHCPVYSRIGGHAYDTTYPGPIGKILTPQMKGLHEAGHLADASSLCGACVEVCPVKFRSQIFCCVYVTIRWKKNKQFHLQNPAVGKQKRKVWSGKAGPWFFQIRNSIV